MDFTTLFTTYNVGYKKKNTKFDWIKKKKLEYKEQYLPRVTTLYSVTKVISVQRQFCYIIRLSICYSHIKKQGITTMTRYFCRTYI